jgi:hypothetical protein
MIHELRTYTIRTEYGGVRELERRFGNAIEVRLKYSSLGGFFHTVSGNMSQVVHIWPYRDLRDRADSRAAANRDESNRWPPGIAELFEMQEVEILMPAPFMAPLEPQEAGQAWELRWFDFRPTDVGSALSGLQAAVPAMEQRGRLVGCWTVDVGPSIGRVYTLSPFENLEQWRGSADPGQAEASWFDEAGARPLTRGLKLLQPSRFSTLR